MRCSRFWRRNQTVSGIPHHPLGGAAAICRSPQITRCRKRDNPPSGPKWAATPTMATARAGPTARAKPAGTRAGLRNRRGFRRGDPFLDQDMGIDAAKPESADGRASGLSRRSPRPGLGLLEDTKRAFLEPQLGGSLPEIRGGWQLPILDSQQNLEQTGCTGGREGVADVRLDRADGAPGPGRARICPERLEALDLDSVTDRGAGGMAFDQVDVGRGPSRILISQPHGAELPLAAGGEQVAATIVRKPNAGQERVNAIAVKKGVGKGV